MVNRPSNAILKCYLDAARFLKIFPGVSLSLAREQKQMICVLHEK